MLTNLQHSKIRSKGEASTPSPWWRGVKVSKEWRKWWDLVPYSIWWTLRKERNSLYWEDQSRVAYTYSLSFFELPVLLASCLCTIDFFERIWRGVLVALGIVVPFISPVLRYASLLRVYPSSTPFWLFNEINFL